MKHIVAWVYEDGTSRFDFRPVHNYTLSDDVDAVPPKARTTRPYVIRIG